MMTTNTTRNRTSGRLMKMAGGAVVLGILATAGCAPSKRTTASSTPAPPAVTLTPGDTPRGADNIFSSDRVIVQKVTFTNQYDMKVTGNLFVPNDLDRSTKSAAMVVGHPMGAVKEQSANLYAGKLAERGFVTMSLDLSFWGESDGEPRNVVAPDNRPEMVRRQWTLLVYVCIAHGKHVTVANKPDHMVCSKSVQSGTNCLVLITDAVPMRFRRRTHFSNESSYRLLCPNSPMVVSVSFAGTTPQ